MLGGGEHSNALGQWFSTLGIQEKIGQLFVRTALIWMCTLNRGLDSMSLYTTFNSIILQFY